MASIIIILGLGFMLPLSDSVMPLRRTELDTMIPWYYDKTTHNDKTTHMMTCDQEEWEFGLCGGLVTSYLTDAVDCSD